MRAADGLVLALEERGAGRPALLVHGFGGSGAAWGEPVLAGLATACRVLAPDLAGHGASDDPASAARVALDRVLDDLERVLDAAGVTACAWIGYSMGGRLALAAAVLRPARVERLVLESATPGLGSEEERRVRREADDALARSLEEGGVEAWVEGWERSPLFVGRAALEPAVRAAFLAGRRANRPGSLAAWLRGVGTGSQPSFWERLAEVTAPTLLVTGEQDAKFTEIAARVQRGIRGARHVVVPGAGHTVHLERPAAWLDAVGPFLTR